MQIKYVTCFGSGEGKVGDHLYEEMVKVGRLLAENGVTIATGAYGGVGMEAPAKGAKEAGGKVVGLHLGKYSEKKPNPFLTSSYDASIASNEVGFLTKPPEFHDAKDTYLKRLEYLLNGEAFIIAGGMSLGTLVEFLAVVNLNEKFWTEPRRVALLHPNLLQSKYSVEEAASLRRDDAVLEILSVLAKQRGYLQRVETATEAVNWVLGKT